MVIGRICAVLALLAAGMSIAQARPFTDAAGRKVELPEAISRVFAAGPPAAVLAYVLAPDKLAGWVRAPGAAEKPFLLPSVRDLPTTGRLTGKEASADAAAVLAAKPDIILDVGTVNADYAALADRIQKETGVPYVLIDGSLAHSGETLREVGGLLGVPERGRELAGYADATLGKLKETLARVPQDSRPRIYYGRGVDGLETGLAGSINLEAVEAMGAVNVASVAGNGGLTHVSLQQIAAWKPDVILAETAQFAKSAGTDAALAGIPAVRDGRIYVPPSLPFGWIDSPPSVNRLIGLRWLEHRLYPQFFSGDLAAETRRFYRMFYGVDPGDDAIAGLLQGAAAP